MKFEIINSTTNWTDYFSNLTTNLTNDYSGKAFTGNFRFPIRGCFGSNEKITVRAFSFGSKMKKCDVSECNRPFKAKGFCNLHYDRLLHHGDINANFFSKESRERRFWLRVAKTENPDECWEWQGKFLGKYGQLSLKIDGYHFVTPHRASYYFSKGHIPKHLIVLHSCDNPACCNPAHLSLGTHADNMNDMYKKGRGLNGEKRFNAKLTESIVKEIRLRASAGKFNIASYARHIGVSKSTVHSVVKGRTWKYV